MKAIDHSGPILCMDGLGEWVVTGSRDHTAVVWRRGRGVRIAAHQDWVTGVRCVCGCAAACGACPPTNGLSVWSWGADGLLCLSFATEAGITTRTLNNSGMRVEDGPPDSASLEPILFAKWCGALFYTTPRCDLHKYSSEGKLGHTLADGQPWDITREGALQDARAAQLEARAMKRAFVQNKPNCMVVGSLEGSSPLCLLGTKNSLLYAYDLECELRCALRVRVQGKDVDIRTVLLLDGHVVFTYAQSGRIGVVYIGDISGSAAQGLDSQLTGQVQQKSTPRNGNTKANVLGGQTQRSGASKGSSSPGMTQTRASPRRGASDAQSRPHTTSSNPAAISRAYTGGAAEQADLSRTAASWLVHASNIVGVAVVERALVSCGYDMTLKIFQLGLSDPSDPQYTPLRKVTLQGGPQYLRFGQAEGPIHVASGASKNPPTPKQYVYYTSNDTLHLIDIKVEPLRVTERTARADELALGAPVWPVAGHFWCAPETSSVPIIIKF